MTRVACAPPAEVADLARLPAPKRHWPEGAPPGPVFFQGSRGCSSRCAFCTSARTRSVRRRPVAALVEELRDLARSGARQVKWVDRTFNDDPRWAAAVLEAVLEEGLPLSHHFEVRADRVGEDLVGLMARFPAGTVQVEVGVQSLDPAVLAACGRAVDPARLEVGIRRLLAASGVAVHFDLLIGLPRQTEASLEASFDATCALLPDALHVETTKVLPGTPLWDGAPGEGTTFLAEPPYAVLATPTLPARSLQHWERVARLVDLYYNERAWPPMLAWIWRRFASPSDFFLRFAGWWLDRGLDRAGHGPAARLAHLGAFLPSDAAPGATALDGALDLLRWTALETVGPQVPAGLAAGAASRAVVTVPGTGRATAHVHAFGPSLPRGLAGGSPWDAPLERALEVGFVYARGRGRGCVAAVDMGTGRRLPGLAAVRGSARFTG